LGEGQVNQCAQSGLLTQSLRNDHDMRRKSQALPGRPEPAVRRRRLGSPRVAPVACQRLRRDLSGEAC